MDNQTTSNPATGFKPLTQQKWGIDEALKALKSWPTQEEMDTEGFCMAHFYSELQCHIAYLLEVGA
tara:strand:- start:1857 stop:2054 length:198 start_codon:yes stop_codon:yes gene_type:complete